MSERSHVSISIPLNFPLIFLVVFFIHAFLMILQGPQWKSAQTSTPKINTLNIREIRKIHENQPMVRVAGKKDGIKNSFAPIEKARHGQMVPKQTQKKPLSLSDLAQMRGLEKIKPTRPGARPEVLPTKPKGINAISLKGNQIHEFKTGAASAKNLSGDPRSKQLINSDVLVNLEVPEGVELDELNKYELMFYGFQRRTAINYINSFYKNLDKFQKENPHIQFPNLSEKQVMTGRMTFDEKGNVKQIKMIRWSYDDKLQGFFEEVLKSMDTLHNPPQALWKKTGEFSIFFSLVVNG